MPKWFFRIKIDKDGLHHIACKNNVNYCILVSKTQVNNLGKYKNSERSNGVNIVCENSNNVQNYVQNNKNVCDRKSGKISDKSGFKDKKQVNKNVEKKDKKMI